MSPPTNLEDYRAWMLIVNASLMEDDDASDIYSRLGHRSNIEAF
jgi:hypothetical protein